MKRRTLSTNDTPKVLVETQKNLVVIGWDQPSVMAEAGISDELVMEQSGNVVTISGDDLRLSVPRGATCIVESCGGQAALRQLSGSVSVGNVGGSLSLDAVGGVDAPVSVETVGGEFSAHEIGGALTVQLVGGHAVVADVAGLCTLDQVGGHLELNQIGGGLRAEVGGHASLSFDPMPGGSYRVEAGGNILCALPDTANAELSMESPVFAAKGGDDVRKIVLGEGGATIHLEANGAIRVNHPAVHPTIDVTNETPHDQNEEGGRTHNGEDNFESDIDIELEDLGILAESFAADLAAKLTSKLGVLSERLPGMLASAGLSNADADEISRQVQESTQRAAERAQAKAKRAAEKATRKAERRLAKARRKVERASIHASVARPPRPPRPPYAPGVAERVGGTTQPPAQPVSAEERMTILRMLQEQKISVAQAETLLSALEGSLESTEIL